MAKKPLSPKAKKALVYGGIGVAGLGLVLGATLQTEPKAKIREPQLISLTGSADTRAVSLEGLNRRLADLETGGARDASSVRSEINRLETALGNLTRQLELQQKAADAEMNKRIAALVAQQEKERAELLASQPGPGAEGGQRVAMAAPVVVPRVKTVDELEAERRRRRAELDRQESIYLPPKAAPIPEQRTSAPAAPAPRIAIYEADRDAKKDAARDHLANIPDVEIPSGSILSAYLLTGLDAPTGTRAQSQPVPVLMRIKKEAILPNYAWADVQDCHLLGSAYGELGSERVNIRGETVSCILRDNSAVEGKVKFFVAGEDGKNGIKGTLVSRSGRVLASAAGAALAQGLLSSLDDSSSSSVFLGGSSGSNGALEGASKGFDLLTEYYLDLAEQTFPVIEVTNDRWVDVVITEMLTIKFKG